MLNKAFLILYVILVVVILTILTGHGESISGFQLTGPLDHGGGSVPVFTVGPKFTILTDDPTLRKLLWDMDGKKVVIRVEVKK